MGSTATIIGAIALATGLVSLLCGYLWGRSNAKSQVEAAVDQAQRSFDAREFALREELEEKMLEIAQFRARAEERPPSQGRDQLILEQVNGSTGQMQSSAAGIGAPVEEQANPTRAAQRLAEQKQSATPPPIDPTEKTIQNLLKSMEEKLKQPEQQVVTPKVAPTQPPPAKLRAEESKVVPQKIAPAPAKLPAAAEPKPVAQQQSPRPAQPPPAVKQPPQPAVKQPAPVKDEWQDFAASLEALTRRTK
jgi:hypothetical protein